MSDNTLKVNILSSVFGRKFSSDMNIFSLVFLMHVLERKNEESFDLVEFVAIVNLSMGTCAASISSGVSHQIFCF